VTYAEFRPPESLRTIVARTWERSVPRTEAPPNARVLPDGCVDLVWRGDRLIVAGPDGGPFLSPLEPGETVVGLRLRPGLAGSVLGLPMSELRNLRIPLADIWGRQGIELAERVGEAATPADRRRALEEAVAARIGELGLPDPIVSGALRFLGRPGSRVGRLPEALGIGERQLLRRFDAAIGYGPKVLDRVLRFQRFIARTAAVADDLDQLARVAADLGYADQPHLTRECRRLSGLSPAQLVASRSAFQAT
jgi:AraC-like DNA-binding protein